MVSTPRQAGLLLMLVLLMSGQLLFAQSRQVTGVVKDPAGETIIGAAYWKKVLRTVPLPTSMEISH